MYKVCKELVLASASPRRAAFLDGLGLVYTISTPRIDEKHCPGENPVDYVRRMAQEKALWVAAKHPQDWIVSADTAVTIDGITLGKPVSEDDAVNTLLLLSGRDHKVVTGFSLVCREAGVAETGVVSTRVRFTRFGEDLARAYVKTGEPLDKAGSYGIQGVGGQLVAEIDGSYTNVVGLPLAELVALLLRHEVIRLS